LASTAVGALLALILLSAAAPAGARLDPWRKNTFQVTRAGLFHADFLMSEWFQGEEGFFIQIVGPTRVSHCSLRYGTKTERAQRINLGFYPDVYFLGPGKGLRSATRATATCHLAGGQVTASTVFVPIGIRASRIALRRR
jgi:hypothetical protein